MRRLFLAAGVASLAIAGVAAAKPGGDHGGGGGNPQGGDRGNPHGGGGGGAPAFAGGGNPHGGDRGAPDFAGGGGHGGGHGGGGGPAAMGGGGERGHGGGFAPMFARGEGGGRGHGGGFAPPQMRGFGGGGHGQGRGGYAAPQMRAYAGGGGHGRGSERQQARAFAGGHDHNRSYQGFARERPRAFASQGHGHGQHGLAHQQARAFAGAGHGQQQQGQRLAHQQMRGFERQQAPLAQGQQLRANSMQAAEQQALTNGRLNGQQLAGVNALRDNAAQFANQPAWNGVSPYQSLAYGNNVQILPVQQAEQFVGVPVANVASFASLAPLPSTIQYLYPDTPDYYYRWGDGYLYQVDRTDNLIAALIPLLAGGYLPGQYLPQPYMASYVPSDYGFDSFYPDDGDVCNRYYDGVIYQVDCSDGYVENVIPMYAGGYGVGQLLPSANTYYNVPMQYRDLYYDTPDYGYWYAPGAIYQYDPRTSVITSVAALMSPGFSVGQPLPVGYDAYNVPYGYRETYYDTPDAWYRYSNGYIYQVDPVTQVVTAIVASLLT